MIRTGTRSTSNIKCGPTLACWEKANQMEWLLIRQLDEELQNTKYAEEMIREGKRTQAAKGNKDA